MTETSRKFILSVINRLRQALIQINRYYKQIYLILWQLLKPVLLNRIPLSFAAAQNKTDHPFRSLSIFDGWSRKYPSCLVNLSASSKAFRFLVTDLVTIASMVWLSAAWCHDRLECDSFLLYNCQEAHNNCNKRNVLVPSGFLWIEHTQLSEKVVTYSFFLTFLSTALKRVKMK